MKTENSNGHRERLVHIDMMVGLAMLLVVIGHFSLGFEPMWYSDGLHNWIYSFHMELFVFLSAFLIRYTYKEVKSTLEYTKYIWRKFKKFFLWFLIIGITVALIACPVKNIPFSTGYFWSSLRTLLLYPRLSEASFLWYIYILFGFYIISPLFFRLPPLAKTIVCVATLFLPMIDASDFLAARDFCLFAFFYCLGTLCAEWINDLRGVKTWLWAVMSVPFLVYSFWLFGDGIGSGFQYPQLGWWRTVTGVASLPFFYLLAMLLAKIKVTSKILYHISVNCYWIYLLQMFVIWGCARLLHQSMHTGAIPFWLFMVVTASLAIAVPIFLAYLYRMVVTKGRKGKNK